MVISGSRLREVAQEIIESKLDLHVGPASIDLHLAPEMVLFDSDSAIHLGDDGKAYYHGARYVVLSNNEQLVLEAPGLVIASTVEYVRLPSNIAALMLLRSSIGRRGINHAFSGWVDPGFEGTLTFELTPSIKQTFLVPGERIAQLILFDTTNADGTYVGQYKGQRGPTLAYGMRPYEADYHHLPKSDTDDSVAKTKYKVVV